MSGPVLVGQALLPVRFVCAGIVATIRRTLSLSLASTEDRQECLSYLSKNDQNVMFVAVINQGNVR
jgi:hypothetical protein